MGDRHSVDRLDAGDPEHIVAAFEEVSAALVVFEGPSHIIVAANRAGRRLAGERGGLIGLPVREALPELEGQQIYEQLDEVYARQERFSQPERRVLVDRKGDGQLVEGFYAWTYAPVDFGHGRRGVAAHATDTTELVRRREAAEIQALASERRYREAHELVLALQANLLPAGVPVLPAVRLAARYLAAEHEAAAGGDLFDAVPLGDGRVVLLVGDVVGHGTAAAAAMGQVRAVALEALSSGVGLVETVARLDGLAGRLATARGASVCLVELDPDSGRMRYTSRAHPPPLVLDAAGGARLLPVVPGPPLGFGSAAAVVRTECLRPGQVLLVFSDGLVERAGCTLADGQQRLARVALAASREQVVPDGRPPRDRLERLCELVVERMGTLGYRDDVTLLAAELRPERVPVMCQEWPARPGTLAQIRQALRDWLDTVGAGQHDAGVLVHATVEACANAVEHAYAGDDRADGQAAPVRVTGELSPDGTLVIEVSDHGHWQRPKPDPAWRGRGLMLMRALIERVDIESTSDGTRVLLRHRLHRPVVVGAGSAAPVDPADPRAPFATVLSRAEHPVLAVSGPVDQDTVETLRRAVLEAWRGGGLPLTLDLGEVTHLASAGLQLLHEMDAQATGTAGFWLRAPTDSVAHEVLRLGGLAHRLLGCGTGGRGA